ncbi:hypothetical protein Hanom_Chr03g00256561 [Helianthus anomalus]
MLSKKGQGSGGLSIIKEENIERTIKISEDVKAFHFLYGRALIGRTIDLSILTKMDRNLLEVGFGGMEIHYVGVGFSFEPRIQPAHFSIDDGDLSSTCVGVLVGNGKVINESVSITWKDRRFKVWIVEVNDIWVPECMGIVGFIKDSVSDVPKPPAPVESSEVVEQVVENQESSVGGR